MKKYTYLLRRRFQNEGGTVINEFFDELDTLADDIYDRYKESYGDEIYRYYNAIEEYTEQEEERIRMDFLRYFVAKRKYQKRFRH